MTEEDKLNWALEEIKKENKSLRRMNDLLMCIKRIKTNEIRKHFGKSDNKEIFK